MLLTHPIEYDLSGQNKLMRNKELIKAEHLSIVKSQASTSYSIFSNTGNLWLPDRANYKQSDQFSNSGREKSLVSSSYSSAAVEFPTAITDRLCKQSESSSAEFQYKTNYCALQRCLTVLLSREKGCQFFRTTRFRLWGIQANYGTVLQY